MTGKCRGVLAARVLCGAQDARITRQPCDHALTKKRGVRPVALRPTLSGGLPLSGSFSLSSPFLRNFIGRKTYCVELVSHPLATLRCDPRPIQFSSYAHSDALASSRWEHYRRNSRLVSTKSIVPHLNYIEIIHAHAAEISSIVPRKLGQGL